MKKIVDLKQSGGRLEIFTKGKLFLVKPSGIINPSLVKRDLELAFDFGLSNTDWIYVVDAENVLFPNPLNLLYLSQIKKLPNKKKYIIYAPSFVVRTLGKLTSFIVKPDLILKNKEDYQIYMESIAK